MDVTPAIVELVAFLVVGAMFLIWWVADAFERRKRQKEEDTNVVAWEYTPDGGLCERYSE